MNALLFADFGCDFFAPLRFEVLVSVISVPSVAEGLAFHQPDAAKPASGERQLVACDRESRGRRKRVFEHHVGPRCNACGERADEPAQRRVRARPQKFIEEQDDTAGPQHARRFPERLPGLGNDRKNQVQHGVVEARVLKRQGQAVALDQAQIKPVRSRRCTNQHRVRQVESGVTMAIRQMRQVETGADAVQQDLASAGLWELCQVLPAGLDEGGARDPIVKRREQRVAEPKAQCSTRGIDSVNSGIGASNFTPSSATI